MGVSTDGQICYGIAFEGDFEFPWNDYDDIDEWWICGVHKFKPSFEIYDENGGYINGKCPADADISKYYGEKHDFAQNHPMPVELVMHCSYDYPMYILAVQGSRLRNSRGYPVGFSPDNLVVSDESKAALLKFCADFGIECEGEPKWLLTSMWG
jgi:hypothetical protein